MLNRVTTAVLAVLLTAGVSIGQVSMSGAGLTKTKPDMARVGLAVVTEGKTGAAATLANTQAMTKLCAVVEACKIDAKDIQTSGFSLIPNYVYDQGQTPRLTGYTCANGLHVTVRNLAVLGQLLDSATTSGANHVSGIAWDSSDRQTHADSSRSLALADARRKADLYAKAGGFKVGELLELHEDVVYDEDGGGRYSLRDLTPANTPGGRPAVPISPGEITIKSTVHVKWKVVGN